MSTKSIENYNKLRDLLTAQFGFTLPDHTKSRAGRVIRLLELLAESEVAGSKMQYERAVVESATKDEAAPVLKAISEVMKGYQNKPVLQVVRELRVIHEMTTAV